MLQKATTAKQENEDAKELELIKLAVGAAQVAGEGILNAENLNKELRSIFNNNTITVKEISEEGWSFKNYKIDKNGRVDKLLLPDEFQQVEYIETTGQQYIDTEYVFRNRPKLLGEIMIKSSEDLDIMGNSIVNPGCFILDFQGSTLYYRYSSNNRTVINANIEINKWYNFEFSDKVRVNNIEKGNVDSYDFSNNNQTFLIGKGRTFGFAKFKEIKMYDGDELVRDFIPCYRKSDNIGGMFDIKNNKLYTDKMGVNFYYRKDMNKLLNEDSELEYIETTGEQYIDTEYIFRNKAKILGEIMIRTSEDLDIMGNSIVNPGCFILDFQGSTLYYRYSSNNRTVINTNIEINKWYNFEFSDKVRVNNIEKGNIDSYDFSNNNQTFLIGKGRTFGFAKFKEIKMYDGDTLVRDFIPYYKKDIDKVGMLDKLTNLFYENKGIGDDFIPGPEV